MAPSGRVGIHRGALDEGNQVLLLWLQNRIFHSQLATRFLFSLLTFNKI